MEKNPRETEERRNSDSLPLDMLFDILLRLPAKSVARLVGVSKLFATIIRSKDFTRAFRLRSSKQKQRILLAFTELDKEKGRENCMACPAPDIRYDRPECVHGLVSFVYGGEQVICNPSTGISITLPLVKSRRVLKRYLGYDPVDGQFKVLCVTEPIFSTDMRVAASECVVFTLGSSSSSSHDQNSSWRKIECSSPHRPRSNGVCINGVLYYYANMGTRTMERPSLVRFQVRSEDFDFLTKLPTEDQYWIRTGPRLINYQGKVALVNGIRTTFSLWVLEDFEKQEWVEVTLSLSPWRGEIRLRPLDVRGTTQTGEIIYASCDVDDFYLLHHDRKMNDLNVVEIELEESSEYEFGRFGGVVSFLDYVESIMLS
ncbi:putative F-box protein At1g31000 [Eutrema salsugineum]|uniref:putative F-box protein At1g31000 n=1 Tax=Eutrema salsugineum TaxID=72664 RepID=UPI000CED1B44|nr:putative F-box protein At1g31000 [Eutrema salsugineum]